MKLNNCLNCVCHRDNIKQHRCPAGRHNFLISEKQAEKYNWAINYIKKEVADDRHILASLGSAGFTFVEDIKRLANYAYAIGDKDFYNLIITQK